MEESAHVVAFREVAKQNMDKFEADIKLFASKLEKGDDVDIGFDFGWDGHQRFMAYTHNMTGEMRKVIKEHALDDEMKAALKDVLKDATKDMRNVLLKTMEEWRESSPVSATQEVRIEMDSVSGTDSSTDSDTGDESEACIPWFICAGGCLCRRCCKRREEKEM